ncbi:hypothetical protein [Aliamphritea hakodatensis]|uniref:hypothetical protein n=1 Tax=Aliamphritea hakodatensis TaxID=2895352 RepID=UPI0022FDA2A4|nr:hypothetical protein [Aliamphritea hakodatensis]
MSNLGFVKPITSAQKIINERVNRYIKGKKEQGLSLVDSLNISVGAQSENSIGGFTGAYDQPYDSVFNSQSDYLSVIGSEAAVKQDIAHQISWSGITGFTNQEVGVFSLVQDGVDPADYRFDTPATRAFAEVARSVIADNPGLDFSSGLAKTKSEFSRTDQLHQRTVGLTPLKAEEAFKSIVNRQASESESSGQFNNTVGQSYIAAQESNRKNQFNNTAGQSYPPAPEA